MLDNSSNNNDDSSSYDEPKYLPPTKNLNVVNSFCYDYIYIYLTNNADSTVSKYQYVEKKLKQIEDEDLLDCSSDNFSEMN
jgi:hypothetical protein